MRHFEWATSGYVLFDNWILPEKFHIKVENNLDVVLCFIKDFGDIRSFTFPKDRIVADTDEEAVIFILQEYRKMRIACGKIELFHYLNEGGHVQ